MNNTSLTRNDILSDNCKATVFHLCARMGDVVHSAPWTLNITKLINKGHFNN